MNRLIKKIKTPIVIITLLIIGTTYLTFFLPMKRELENSYLKNFRFLSESKVYSIRTFIENGLDYSKSLSSESMKRSKILAYKNGEIGFDEIKQYIKAIDKEKIELDDDLIGVISVVGDIIISKYGVYNIEEMDKLDKSLFYDYSISVKDDDIMQLIVYSPITEQNLILGYDIIYFNRSKVIKDLMNEEISIDIVNKTASKELVEYGRIIESNDSSVLLDFDDKIGYIAKLDSTDNYIYTYTFKDNLYSPIKKIAIISQGSIILGLLILFTVIKFIILRNANKILSDVEYSRDKYKEHAYKDPLTGVCSRLFLDTWVENNLKELEEQKAIYSIAMIDGDNFKEINDNYGHSIGDKVLIKVAEILKKSVRQNDIVIRYGGDEFLIIFEDIDCKIAESILNRIENKLDEINEFDFDISISYGVSEIKNSEEFFQSLNKADEKMYSSKHNKV